MNAPNIVSLSVLSIYFFYGLSFFILGFGILCINSTRSVFKLSQVFWLLMLFGILHGLHEWLEMLFLLGKSGFGDQYIGVLDILLDIDWCIIVASFGFLLCFGIGAFLIKAIQNPNNLFWLYLRVPVLIAVSAVYLHGASNFLIISNILSRYFLCFPGALLTGIAFLYWAYQPEVRSLSSKWTIVGFVGTAFSFILYAVFAGIIVPKGDFFQQALSTKKYS